MIDIFKRLYRNLEETIQPNWYVVLAGAYVGLFTGLTIGSIGQVPSGEPYSWLTVVTTTGAVIIPFLLGYLGGAQK